MRASWIFLLYGVTLFVGSSVVSEPSITQASSQSVTQVYHAATTNCRRSLRSDVKADEVTDVGDDERGLKYYGFKGLEDLRVPLLIEVKEAAMRIQKEEAFGALMQELHAGGKVQTVAEGFAKAGIDLNWLTSYLKLKNPEKMMIVKPKALTTDQALWLAVAKHFVETRNENS